MARTAFVLILTDDPQRGERLRDALRERHGHACNVVNDLDEALASIRAKAPDVVVARARLNGASPIDPLVETLEQAAPDAALVTLGEDGEVPRPDSPTETGRGWPDSPAETGRGWPGYTGPGYTAQGYAGSGYAGIALTRLADTDAIDDLVSPIGAAADQAIARREDRLLAESFEAAEIPSFEGIVGNSPKILKIIERIRKAARNKLTVLINGETGTGKELIAHAIHKHSDRAGRPFKELNCAGLNENLLESELFGHVRGAFTSAVSDRKGYFEAAHGGSLFLDEIGDMPLTMQAKLLRVLENREITPVGATDVRRVDVRVIAATHRNLSEMVQKQEFREDLYYRLNQWVIAVPPLRERRQDVPLLAHHFIKLANQRNGTSVAGVSSGAMNQLIGYHWPGNVRELANTIEPMVVEAEQGRMEADLLPERMRGAHAIVPISVGGIAGLTLAQMERVLIQHTLDSTGGNREQAARMLGIGTRTLYRKIKEYELS
jgi:two-component system response regulator HydG